MWYNSLKAYITIREACGLAYQAVTLKDDILIKKIVTVHYFEYSKSFKFVGESHDFWEWVYVDKGGIVATRGTERIPLKAGSMIFHKPNEWHNLEVAGGSGANASVVTFVCNSPGMKAFEGKIFNVGYAEKALIAKIISESKRVFSTPLGDPYTQVMEKNKKTPFGSEQLIRQYICELLILLRRSEKSDYRSVLKLHSDDRVFNEVIDYMNKNINRRITVAEITEYCSMSKTALNNIFQKNSGMGVIAYFINMKISAAKSYIQENNYNITQIADMLGYESIHYFSRQFKRVTDMSPSEYALSIKSIEKEI